MEIHFSKYQGTGNDFVMVDNRDGVFFKKDTSTIAQLCNRRFGIGADGLILLERDEQSDFRMIYYNSDGNQSSMCGNGGRCIVAFAKRLGIVSDSANFTAVDGPHMATIDEKGLISLQMKDVSEISVESGFVFLDTGSPHHVALHDNLDSLDVKSLGAQIRYNQYGEKGSNVNFVKQIETDIFAVRTYERGVEDETLSCGTGVTAAAIAMRALGKTSSSRIEVKTPGGTLTVSFIEHEGRFAEVYLTGPTEFVFSGTITI